MNAKLRFMALLCGGLLWASTLSAEEAGEYLKHIKPVLHERCYACHGSLKQESGLRLDTAALAIQGGDGGAAVLPGDAEGSPLLQRVMSKDESVRMPPEGEPLKPEQIAAIRTWISNKAPLPAHEQPERDPRDHWAFQTPQRPPVPTVKNAAWQTNPIDAFIAHEHETHGLTAQPAADKRVWLRRVTLDLIGLPPTREELEAFVADDSPAAYDTVVTRLLASPHYGERWGRHFMDIWRYSDWWGLGADLRNSQKHIWHWRDWIIESLNDDKGYHQMLLEMLAADELYPNDLNRLRASGFLARQYFKFNRTSWMDETIEHTSKAMLGMTFNCAKCHDHKFDPLTQVEYYRMRAIFEPYQVRMDMLPGETDLEKDGLPRAFDCNLNAPTYLHIRGNDSTPDKNQIIEPSFPAFLSYEPTIIEPISLPLEAHQPGLRPFVLETYLKEAQQQIAEARHALDAAQTKLTELTSAEPPTAEAALQQAKLQLHLAEKTFHTAQVSVSSLTARAAADVARFQTPVPENLDEAIASAVLSERKVAVAKAEEEVARQELALAQAEMGKKEEVEKKRDAAITARDKAVKALEEPLGKTYTSLQGALKTLESNVESAASRAKPFPTTSTGRRTAFAKWLIDPQHPLTARVAVNHLWLRHFGKPLVPTVFDFGRRGTPPTHPELLDWLAVELREKGWSMKHLHRLMVTSQAYRLSSSSAEASVETLAADGENRFYWRMNAVRMEAQTVRDSLLHLAGELDLTTGGPPIPANDEKSRRRSLYFFHSHNEHQKFLAMFDDANVLDCYRRSESIVPQQALALENSPLVTSTAAKISQRLAQTFPSDTDTEFIRAAFLTVLNIEPSPAEMSIAAEMLPQLAAAAELQKRPNPPALARVYLILALLNHNDFLTIR